MTAFVKAKSVTESDGNFFLTNIHTFGVICIVTSVLWPRSERYLYIFYFVNSILGKLITSLKVIIFLQ